MSPMTRLIRTALCTGMLFGIVLIAGAASAAEIDCEIPNDVRCTVTDPTGIQHVTVTLATGQGPVAVVNQAFPACPKTVEVSWDPIVPGAQFEVETCRTAALTFATQVGSSNGKDKGVLVLARDKPQRELNGHASFGLTCDGAPANGVRLVLGSTPGEAKDVCDGCDHCVFGCCWDGFPTKCNELTSG